VDSRYTEPIFAKVAQSMADAVAFIHIYSCNIHGGQSRRLCERGRADFGSALNLPFRAYFLGSASGGIPTPSGSPPEHLRRSKPASVYRSGFECRASGAPKSSSVPSENAHPSAALGSLPLKSARSDLSLVGRPRQMGTKGENMNQSR
jgi:hypothetical protein